MDERKQYAKKVVTSIINFMALAGAGILPDKETAIEMISEIPEEFHREIMASLMAAREVRKISIATSIATPLSKILQEAMKETEE